MVWNKRFSSIKTGAQNRYNKTRLIVKKRPLLSFVVALAILLAVIFLSNLLTPQVKEPEKNILTKEVKIYQIGTSPKVSMQAQIEKTGIIKITAQGSGVVSNINVKQGASVSKGQNLLSLSTNYQGGSVQSVQRQMAQAQYNNAKDNFDTQKQLIQSQKQAAEKADTSSDDLRDFANRSLSETQSLIDLNDSILSSLNSQQSQIEASPNPSTPVDQQTVQVRQLKSQLVGANNQLRSALRNSEFQAASDQAPAQLSDLQKDIALKQLDLQDKSLDLNKEVLRLQLNLAQISESIMFPSAPYAGVVERVFVRTGQTVNPGTPLLTITGNVKNLTAIVLVNQNLAQNISSTDTSTIQVGNKQIESTPSYVSSEATDGNLYSVIYELPESLEKLVTDGSFVNIEIPVGTPDTGSTIPFIPIDSVFQSQEKSEVFVVDKDKAASREVILGDVFGSYVEVKSGLDSGDQVILNRNVVSGEQVRIVN